MMVSIPMFWTLRPSGTCPYQAPTSRPPCILQYALPL
jgi:hypothetical protein